MADQHRDGRLIEDFRRLAAGDQVGDAAPAVRGHQNQVAPLFLGRLDIRGVLDDIERGFKKAA